MQDPKVAGNRVLRVADVVEGNLTGIVSALQLVRSRGIIDEESQRLQICVGYHRLGGT